MTLKAHSLPAIAPALGRALAAGATLVTAQNGIPWWYFQRFEGPLAGTRLETVDPGGVIAGQIPIESVFERLGGRGVRRFVYSSIDRDGMLDGPDLEGARRAAHAVRGSLIYSGGVSSVDDLRALAQLREVNLHGVIVGKALYEGRFTVSDGQTALA